MRNEYEADRVGVDLMYQAQFKPQGMVEFFEIMAQLSGSGGIEYLRTHPITTIESRRLFSRVEQLPQGRDQVDDYDLFRDYLLYTSQDHLEERGSEFRRALAQVKQADYVAGRCESREALSERRRKYLVQRRLRGQSRTSGTSGGSRGRLSAPARNISG